MDHYNWGQPHTGSIHNVIVSDQTSMLQCISHATISRGYYKNQGLLPGKGREGKAQMPINYSNGTSTTLFRCVSIV